MTADGQAGENQEQAAGSSPDLAHGSVANAGTVKLDFTDNRSQMLLIEGVRLGFLVVTLGATLAFQAAQPEFVNTEILVPVYVLLSAAFAVNLFYLTFFEKALKRRAPTAALFFFESIFITGLIHLTGVNQSLFLFLHLVNIILCGFVFKKRGAYLLAFWTATLFNSLLILGPELEGQTLYFAFALNNLSFFAVAHLSGYLSEQLNFMGSALQRQGKDIRALRNLNALIIDNVSTGLVTIDESGEILLANRAAIEILDPIPAEIVGKKLEDVVPGLLSKTQEFASRSRELVAYGATDATGATGASDEDAAIITERFDHSYKTPVGDRLILEVIVSPLPEGSAIRGAILTFQDLSRVRRLEFQMRQSEKMAAVGQLAAGIAHEIRNPLASMSGSIQLLGGSFTGRQEEEQRLMAIVLREIDRLNNLVTEFLDYVRPDQLKDDPVDVNGLIREVCEMLKLNAKLRQETVQTLSLAASQEIAGHRDKLKQALLNITINAYQAMNDASEPKVEIATFDSGTNVVIKIKDHGCGIDEVGLRKIFEPFHTTKPKGTGLGLAVTHKIIEAHGGRVFVESTKGVGTEFTLEFPAKAASNLDKNALADSQRASENFQKAFRGQKRGNG